LIGGVGLWPPAPARVASRRVFEPTPGVTVPVTDAGDDRLLES